MGQGDPPIFCELSNPREIEARRKLLWSVFRARFRFPEKLARIVNTERTCCAFLTFALLFELDGGQISLRVTRPVGAKPFIETELMSPPSA